MALYPNIFPNIPPAWLLLVSNFEFVSDIDANVGLLPVGAWHVDPFHHSNPTPITIAVTRAVRSISRVAPPRFICS